jgi:hypothetical protein
MIFGVGPSPTPALIIGRTAYATEACKRVSDSWTPVIFTGFALFPTSAAKPSAKDGSTCGFCDLSRAAP